jgi:hypothetical protein
LLYTFWPLQCPCFLDRLGGASAPAPFGRSTSSSRPRTAIDRRPSARYGTPVSPPPPSYEGGGGAPSEIALRRREFNQRGTYRHSNISEPLEVEVQLGSCLGAGLRVRRRCPLRCLIRHGVALDEPGFPRVGDALDVHVCPNPLEAPYPVPVARVSIRRQDRRPMLALGVCCSPRILGVGPLCAQAICKNIRFRLQLADGQENCTMFSSLGGLGNRRWDEHVDFPHEVALPVHLRGSAARPCDAPNR